MNTTNVDKILSLVENKLTAEERLKLIEYLKSLSNSILDDSTKTWGSRLIFRTFCAAVCGSTVAIPLAIFSKNLLLGTLVGSVFITLIFYGMDQLGNLLSRGTKKDEQ